MAEKGPVEKRIDDLFNEDDMSISLIIEELAEHIDKLYNIIEELKGKVRDFDWDIKDIKKELEK